MKYLLLFLFSTIANASNLIKVGVIDSGFGINHMTYGPNLCKDGHKDFTNMNKYYTFNNIKYPVDYHGHGTNLIGIINSYVNDERVCFVILKYYDLKSKKDNLKAEVEAIKYAKSIGIKVLNISGGGDSFDREEQLAIKEFLDGGGIIFAAAGNNNRDIAKKPYYPAMSDPRVIVVGNRYNGEKSKLSNYGTPVKVWEDGVDVNGFNIILTGTSQATAIATGKFLKKVIEKMN